MGSSLVEHVHNITLHINHSKNGSIELFWWLRENVSLSNMFTISHCKSIVHIRILSNYFDNEAAIFHRRTCAPYYTTNPSSQKEFCWIILINKKEFPIIEHIYNITLHANHSHHSSVELFWWLRENLSLWNILIRLHNNSIISRKVLSTYFVDREIISHHRTCTQYCIQTNHFHQSAVELLRWLRDNLSWSNMLTISHWKSMVFIKILCNYSDD